MLRNYFYTVLWLQIKCKVFIMLTSNPNKQEKCLCSLIHIFLCIKMSSHYITQIIQVLQVHWQFTKSCQSPPAMAQPQHGEQHMQLFIWTTHYILMQQTFLFTVLLKHRQGITFHSTCNVSTTDLQHQMLQCVYWITVYRLQSKQQWNPQGFRRDTSVAGSLLLQSCSAPRSSLNLPP